MASRRFANLHAHLAPPAATPALSASPEPAAGIIKWVTDLFSGGGEALEPVAVADRVSHPGQTWGHVHPDIVQTADGTLVIVHALNENDSPVSKQPINP